jgi:hypothetical protein
MLFIGKIISAVLKAILTPIMELVSFVMRTILGPIFEAILKPLMSFIIELVLKVFSKIFYTILAKLLEFVDVIEHSFKMFAGIGDVTYNGKTTNLLSLFVTENSVLTRAFWLITFLSLALCIVFTIIAVTRSTFDFDFENKRPVGKILGSAGKAGLTFLIIPLFVMFSIQLMTLVMRAVYDATQNEGMSVADTLFQISAMKANKNSSHNLSSTQTFTTGMRAQFNGGGWKDIDKVGNNFAYEKIDYLLGYGLSIFMIFILATIAFTFVQRIFEIMMLYIAAPFFVSSMPLDDGQKFKAWQNLFIGKLVSGMGVIVMVNLYLIAVAFLMGPDIVLDTRSLNTSATGVAADFQTYDYLMKIIFVVGGAIAVKNGGSLLTSIVDYQAGMQEQTTMAQTGATVSRAGMFAGGMALGATATVVGTVGKAAWGTAKFAGTAALRGAQYGLTKKMMYDGKEPPTGGGGDGGGTGGADGSFSGGGSGGSGSALGAADTGGAGAGDSSVGGGGEGAAFTGDGGLPKASAGAGPSADGAAAAGGATAVGATATTPGKPSTAAPEPQVSRTARFLRSAYTRGVKAKQFANEVKGALNTFKSAARGDFSGIFKRNGMDTYESKRCAAFQSGNMVEFLKLGENRKQMQAQDRENTRKAWAADIREQRPWERQ